MPQKVVIDQGQHYLQTQSIRVNIICDLNQWVWTYQQVVKSNFRPEWVANSVDPDQMLHSTLFAEACLLEYIG